ncbi:MAG: hypothetical protein ABMA64_19585 [Myxococcota bacterium]
MNLYTPWSEDWSSLHARTRGRDDAVGAIAHGARQLLAGGRPLPLYFFGPRGIGKSHVVCDGVGGVREALEAHGYAVVTLGEDAAEVSDADVLWARLTPRARPAWMGVDRSSGGPERAMVVVEGLDRQLKALGGHGRKRLRALLDAHPQVWVVGTGARLTDELTAHEEAFYGAFQSFPVQPIEGEDAAALIDHEAGEDTEQDPRWPARRQAIVLLSGGNPRALVALARATRAGPGADVARRLLTVLDEFTPHYQLRFRDLSTQEQQLVELLSQVPRDLGPTDVATRLGSSPATWSSCAHRLADLGVLRTLQHGRLAFYRITEPLFRYWLEFRSGPWGDTRVAWLGHLLELVLGPGELVEEWTGASDETVRTAALQALQRQPKGRDATWSNRTEEVERALASREVSKVEAAVRAAAEVTPSAVEAWALLRRLAPLPFAPVGRLLGPALAHHGRHTLAKLLLGGGDPGELRGLLRDLPTDARKVSDLRDGWVLVIYFEMAAAEIDPRGRRWQLDAREQVRLSAVPFLRGRLARYGRRLTHPPLLGEADLLAAPVDFRSPDLADLLSVTVASEWFTAAGRMLALLAGAPEARLPWCPWPGRRLPVDPGVVLDLIARQPTPAAMSWLGSTTSLPDDRFEALLARPVPHLLPAGRQASHLQLALAALALSRPDPYELLRRGMEERGWRALFERVDLLVSQLREGERGPLHPELARVYEVVRPRAT